MHHTRHWLRPGRRRPRRAPGPRPEPRVTCVTRRIVQRARGEAGTQPETIMRQTSLALALATGFAIPACAETLPEFVSETIVVTPTRFEEPTPATPGNLVVITRQDIERTPATSVPALLAGIVGTTVIPLYGSLGIDSAVSLRGAGSGGTATSNTLVLLNGQRLNPIDSGSIDWSLIPLTSIERIEVMPGSGTVLYGDRSSGGGGGGGAGGAAGARGAGGGGGGQGAARGAPGGGGGGAAGRAAGGGGGAAAA